jgi:AbrB family looped-hinge helix DNA binding protein
MTYTVSITSQGQISIPAILRRKLGLDKMGKAQVTEKEGKLVIEPIRDLLELRGSFGGGRPFTSPALIRKSFEKFIGEKMSK